jgi:hypothetical protein
VLPLLHLEEAVGAFGVDDELVRHLGEAERSLEGGDGIRRDARGGTVKSNQDPRTMTSRRSRPWILSIATTNVFNRLNVTTGQAAGAWG